VPFLEEASKGYSFNWDKILSDNLAKDISDYRAIRARGIPGGIGIELVEPNLKM
jgi:hypothetical protein